MPEKRNSDEGAWSLNDEDTAIVYMCGVDWQHHTLVDADGTLVYGSERALRRKRACVDECGIVEVEMRVRRWVQPQDMPSAARKVETRKPPPVAAPGPPVRAEMTKAAESVYRYQMEPSASLVAAATDNSGKSEEPAALNCLAEVRWAGV